jgi:putative peptide zinc metalloprotease protein
MTISTPIIPHLNPNTSISAQQDSGDYLIIQEVPNNEKIYLRINKYTYDLILLINGKRTLTEIAETYNLQHNSSLTSNSISKIFETNKLKESGIISINSDIPQFMTKQKDTYLWLRVNIIPQKIVLSITTITAFIFTPISFWAILILSFFGFCSVIYTANLSTEMIKYYFINNSVLSIYGFYTATVILHEIGHASAARRFGAIPSSIGFGFYLLSPVFYADVSDIWRLNKHHKIIVNLAGIFMQWLVCVAMMFLYIFIKQPFLFYGALFVFTASLYNLNPFLRYDGYWIRLYRLR